MIGMDLLKAIARIGQKNKSRPHLEEIEIFKDYIDKDNKIKGTELSEIEKNCTRREILARFLLLNAILDQGPDIIGVRRLLAGTVNYLYQENIRIFHEPLSFFQNLNLVIPAIDKVHEEVKQSRSAAWAKTMNTIASKYNLFIESSQTLNYAVFRWGVPIALPLVLKQEKKQSSNTEPLLDHLEQYHSAEIMSKEIKKDKRYGLGKAIGDKAAHLFAKWIIHTYSITRNTDLESWGKYSFEIPFDSNIGRVLFRTGYLLNWATIKDYEDFDVIQKGRGKKGKHYIRVTNIRGKKAVKNKIKIDSATYKELCVNHLMSHKRGPKSYEIQKIPIAQILSDGKFGPGDLDDGLIHIGTKYCLNHNDPECKNCPISELCEGYNNNPELITEYRT